jgi:Protein of unknown function (DUF3558)
VLVLASGCSRTEAGQPAATDGGPGSTSAAQTTAAQGTTTARPAPAVSNPKDARNIAACDALKPEQVAQLGLNPGSRHEFPLPQPFARGCSWDAADSSWGLGFGFDTTRQGLSETYLRRDNYQHFQPRQLGGYPAVDAQTSFNPQDCYTFVGIADTQQLNINVDNRPTGGQTVKPACERLDEIATMIIGNLPPLK